MKTKEEITATTPIIKGQEGYGLPTALIPQLELEVYNKATNKWRHEEYYVELHIGGKKKKTDEMIRITYSLVPHSRDSK